MAKSPAIPQLHELWAPGRVCVGPSELGGARDEGLEKALEGGQHACFSPSPGFQHGRPRSLAPEGGLAYEMSRKAPRAETPTTEGLFWGTLKWPLQVLSLPPRAQPQAHRQLPNWGPAERQ